jgi:Cu/Ag efflux pump CusA
MIEAMIEWSIRNRYLVILASLALGIAGFRALMTMPVDAIPDLSENQVIVFTDWMGRSPQEIEDQVTYPLSVSLQGLAGVKVVRSSSEFNFSMITIIFTDETDYYFARQRVQEKLGIASTFLPPGVTPYMAPARDGPRPDLLVHGRRRRERPGRAPLDSRLVRPLPAQLRPRRRRSGVCRRCPSRVSNRHRP